jgi:hypothetical protein
LARDNVNLILARFIILNKNATPIPDKVGFVVLGCLLAMLVFGLVISYITRNDPVPILKRTKNPYRRYKKVGYRYK